MQLFDHRQSYKHQKCLKREGMGEHKCRRAGEHAQGQLQNLKRDMAPPFDEPEPEAEEVVVARTEGMGEEKKTN